MNFCLEIVLLLKPKCAFYFLPHLVVVALKKKLIAVLVEISCMQF